MGSVGRTADFHMLSRASLLSGVRRRRATLLLASTILLTLAWPIAERSTYRGVVLAPLILLVSLAAALEATDLSRRFRLLLIFLAVAWSIADVSDLALHLSLGGVPSAHFLGLALSVCITLVILHRLMRTRRVTAETLCLAFNGYLIIALAFAVLYSILGAAVPKSFNTPDAHLTQSLFFYFSMVTLTTVGFGDVVAVDPVVRMVVAMEALVGIFYNAVVIARLITLFVPSNPSAPYESDGDR